MIKKILKAGLKIIAVIQAFFILGWLGSFEQSKITFSELMIYCVGGGIILYIIYKCYKKINCYN